MQTQPPSVYVPVETPDNKFWAFLLALLVHIGILGFILYTNHVKNLDGEAMETSIITPDELAAMQGQIRANQVANANGNTAPNPTVSMSPEAAKLNAELAQKQAKWQQQQAVIAADLDKQARQEQQDFANGLQQNKIEEMQRLNEYKTAEQAPDDAPETRDKAPQGIVKVTTTGGSAEAKSNTSQDTANSGIIDGQGKSDKGSKNAYSNYLNSIKATIEANWHAPDGSQGKSLVAHFDISPTGYISKISVDNSDNEAFRSSLIQAIDASNPLSPPPPEVYSQFKSNNFTFKPNK